VHPVDFILRFAETGRDAQRGKLRRHLREAVLRELPDARLEEATGRLFGSTSARPERVRALLDRLHGLSSWSPAERCRLDELEPRFVAWATGELQGAQRVAVRVLRRGSHAFSSTELARRLGRALAVALPQLTVDLRAPDRTLSVEVRDDWAWLYSDLRAGIDRRGPTPPAPTTARFLCDQMLGTLAVWLRMLGFDTTYAHELPDAALTTLASAEGRLLVTRDRALARTRAAPVQLISARTAPGQLRELFGALGLRVQQQHLFSRCSQCNAPLEIVDKDTVRNRVPERAWAAFDRFARCPRCDQVYWQGGHYERIFAAIEEFLDSA
jgi:uncharacterized protein with PIN domain